jgi:hypothetical protein
VESGEDAEDYDPETELAWVITSWSLEWLLSVGGD